MAAGWRERTYYVRVAVLLCVLGVVLLYAWNRHRRLERRTTWVETLEVAIIVVPQGPIAPEVLQDFTARGYVLERRLHEERRRFAPGAEAPFRVTTYAATVALPPPPSLPPDIDTPTGLLRYSWHKYRWTSKVDEAVGLASRGLDARIYLVARPVEDELPRTVEGVGEDGGTVGIVEVDLSDDTIDLGLIVAAHELFHLLGADDRYGPTGAIIVPDGLAEPDLEPLYPQRFTELMARHRAISETEHVLPEDIDELRVGPTTAREIGWLRPPGPRAACDRPSAPVTNVKRPHAATVVLARQSGGRERSHLSVARVDSTTYRPYGRWSRPGESRTTMTMSKKVALVVGVGAPRGIGGATALRAGEAGHIVVPVARTEAKLASLATVIREAGGEAQPVAADITTEEGIQKVFAHVDQIGELDFVLYNAGNMGATSETLEIPAEGFEQAWRVCCWGGLRIGQEAGRRMKARGAGTLIYTGATASLRSKPPFVAFAAAKAGVRALALGLARELWSSGVHVAHVIIDGLVDGETMASRMPDLKAKMAGKMLDPTAIASAFWTLHGQDRSAWTAELDLRPYADTF